MRTRSLAAISTTGLAGALSLALAVVPSTAHAQDSGADGSTGLGDAIATPDGGTRSDAGGGDGGGSMDGGTRPMVSCPDAVSTATAPINFRRMGPVRFGPGTGMSMVGSRSTVGIEYNLLFSGEYDARMSGNLRARWPTALTFTAEPTENGGFFNVRFGLRMVIALYVLGVRIALPTDWIIMDSEGMMSSMFTPWAWNYENTEVAFPVSAWRDIYTYRLNVGGTEYPITLSGRYGMKAYIRTVEIGFPDRDAPAMEDRNLAVITQMMPEAMIPPPRDGRLSLLTRWKPQIKYVGNIELRVRVGRRVCVNTPLGPVCTDVDFMAPSFDIARTEESLPDPFDQEPMFELPVQQVDETEVNFGEVRVGTTEMSTIRVRNPGAAPLGVSATESGDPAFTVGTGACVRAGATGEIPVSFTPPRVGTFRTEIMLNSNGITGTPTRVTLYGIGANVTMPPVRMDGGVTPLPDGGGMVLADGAIVRADGGRGEYRGGRVEAGCACSAGRTGVSEGAGASGRALLGLCGVAGAMAVVGARRKKRAERVRAD